MSVLEKMPQELRHLYEEGCSLRDRIIKLFDERPVEEQDSKTEQIDTRKELGEKRRELLEDIRRWHNTLNLEVLPNIIYNEEVFQRNLNEVVRILYSGDVSDDARKRATQVVGDALSLIKTVPLPRTVKQQTAPVQRSTYTPNTA